MKEGPCPFGIWLDGMAEPLSNGIVWYISINNLIIAGEYRDFYGYFFESLVRWPGGQYRYVVAATNVHYEVRLHYTSNRRNCLSAYP